MIQQFRDDILIAHEYSEIAPKKIWNAATIHVPKLKMQVLDLWLE